MGSTVRCPRRGPHGMAQGLTRRSSARHVAPATTSRRTCGCSVSTKQLRKRWHRCSSASSPPSAVSRCTTCATRGREGRGWWCEARSAQLSQGNSRLAPGPGAPPAARATGGRCCGGRSVPAPPHRLLPLPRCFRLQAGGRRLRPPLPPRPHPLRLQRRLRLPPPLPRRPAQGAGAAPAGPSASACAGGCAVPGLQAAGAGGQADTGHMRWKRAPMPPREHPSYLQAGRYTAPRESACRPPPVLLHQGPRRPRRRAPLPLPLPQRGKRHY